MISPLALKHLIINELSERTGYKVSGNGLFHTVRCPYCGDSSNPNHAHFNVRIDLEDPKSSMGYNCFKCGVSGFVTPAVLNELGINVDSDTMGSLKYLNTKYARSNKIKLNKTEPYDIPLSDTRVAVSKLDYLNTRLGTNFSYQDCQNLRVILSLIDFITINDIRHIDGIPANKLNFYEQNYIGFLSSNKNLLTLRLSNQKIPGMRYYKCKINPNNMDSNSYYAIPFAFDPLYSDTIKVHIAEGTFDILSVYANLNNRNTDHNYYYAVCGFGYVEVLKSIIRSGLTTGIELHIYADNDKKDDDIIRQIKKVPAASSWFPRVIIHRNGSGCKDYGVPKNQIIDTTRQIYL